MRSPKVILSILTLLIFNHAYAAIKPDANLLKQVRQVIYYGDGPCAEYDSVLNAAADILPSAGLLREQWIRDGFQNPDLSGDVMYELTGAMKQLRNDNPDEYLMCLLNSIQLETSRFNVERTDSLTDLFFEHLDKHFKNSPDRKGWILLWHTVIPWYTENDDRTLILPYEIRSFMDNNTTFYREALMQLYITILSNGDFTADDELTTCTNTTIQLATSCLSMPGLIQDHTNMSNMIKLSTRLSQDPSDLISSMALEQLITNDIHSPNIIALAFMRLCFAEIDQNRPSAAARNLEKSKEQMNRLNRIKRGATTEDVELLAVTQSIANSRHLTSYFGMTPEECLAKNRETLLDGTERGNRALMYLYCHTSIKDGNMGSLSQQISDELESLLDSLENSRIRLFGVIALADILKSRNQNSNAYEILDIEVLNIGLENYHVPIQLKNMFFAELAFRQAFLTYDSEKGYSCLLESYSNYNADNEIDFTSSFYKLGVLCHLAETAILNDNFDAAANHIKEYDRQRESYCDATPATVWDSRINFSRVDFLPKDSALQQISQFAEEAEANGEYMNAARLWWKAAYASSNTSITQSTLDCYSKAASCYLEVADFNNEFFNFIREYLFLLYYIPNYRDYNALIHSLIEDIGKSDARLSLQYLHLFFDITERAMKDNDAVNTSYYISYLMPQVTEAYTDNYESNVFLQLYCRMLKLYLGYANILFRNNLSENELVLSLIKSIKEIEDRNIFYEFHEIIPNYEELPRMYSTLVEYYYFVGELTKAKETLSKLKNWYPEYDTWQHDMFALKQSGDTETWISKYLERLAFLLEPAHDTVKTNNISNVTHIISPLCSMYAETGDSISAMIWASKRFDYARSFVEENYMTMDETQRYNMASSSYLTPWDLHAYISYNTPDSLLQTAYDGALYFKGLLLQSGNAVKFEIAERSDTALQRKYDEMISLKRDIVSLHNTVQRYQELKDTTNYNLSLQYLTEVNHRASLLEVEVMDSIADSVTFRGRSELTWRNVAESLKPNEAAIEFIIHGQQFGALILKKDIETTGLIFVSLMSGERLNELLNGWQNSNVKSTTKMLYNRVRVASYNGAELYDGIWAPLEPHLADIERIYYSPVGLLSSVSFNALESPEHKRLCELYDLRLVSSTSEICNHKDITGLPSSISIFGNVTYDSGTDNESNTRGNGNGWGPLNGSLPEICTIDSIMTANKKSVELNTGLDATESRFRTLPSTYPECIMMSTHGFFMRYDEAKTSPFMIGKGYGDSNYTNIPPLSRAGLVLANANPVWCNIEQKPDSIDGILTAEEISDLNLHHTDLVVLSACETGRGDPSATEGVIGVQRALKMSGVKSIVMTLWVVDDAASRMFMELFFENMAAGMERHAAFNKAQDGVRSHWPNDPFFWAPFVMLD